MPPMTRRLVSLLFLSLLAAPLTGCLFPGASGGSDQIFTTNQGIQGRLSGGVDNIVQDVEDVFRFLNIQWSGQSSYRDGTEIRGYRGNDQVTVRLQPSPGEFTQVEVRVKEPAARIGSGDGRWNRDAARLIFSELRKWRAG